MSLSRHNVKKKCVSLLLLFIMVFDILSTSAFALSDVSTETLTTPTGGQYAHVGGGMSVGQQGTGGMTGVSRIIDPNTQNGLAQIEQLLSIVTSCNNNIDNLGLESSLEKGLNYYMINLAQALAAADWFTRNWWTMEGSTSYSVLSPILDGSNTPVSSQSFWNMINQIRNMMTKATNQYNATMPPFNSGTDNVFMTSEDKLFFTVNGVQMSAPVLEDNGVFHDALTSILKYYVDANILYIIAKNENVEGWETTTTYEGLLQLIGNDNSTFYNTVMTNIAKTPVQNTPIKVNNAYGANDGSGVSSGTVTIPPVSNNTTELTSKTLSDYLKARPYYNELLPYLTLYNTVFVDTYATWANTGPADFSIKSVDALGETITKYKGWHKVNDKPLIEEMSFTTQLIINGAAMSTETGVPIGGSNANSNITAVDTSNGVFGIMVENGILVDGNIVIDSNKPNLTDLGYIVLAAGAVYEPFISIAGNEAWLSVVNSFFADGSQKDDITRLLQVALNTKKPLYVSESIQNSWSSEDDLNSATNAQYRYAFLEDALQTDEDSVKVYAVVKGSMQPSQVDNSTWDYIHSVEQDESKESTSTEATVENNNNEGTSVTQDSTRVGKALQKYKSVTSGGTTMSAAADQMTSPIMITSGNKAAWNTLSVKNGTTIAIGGLTSIILHNASVDCKDNKYISNASKSMLFVNGLGDIVLFDGTIVLPAVANPILYDYSTSEATDSENAKEFINRVQADSNYKAYYPYTASFMNYYPTARIVARQEDDGTDGTGLVTGNKLEITNGNDVNKYILLLQGKGDEVWWNWSGEGKIYGRKISKISSNSQATVAQYGSVRTSHIALNSFRVWPDEKKSASILNIGEATGGNTLRNWTLGLISSADDPYNRSHMMFMCRGSAYDGSGRTFFPLYYDSPDLNSDYLSMAGPIVTSTLRYISDNDETTGKKVDSGYFKIDSYINNFVGETLMGTQYAETLVKNANVSYEDLVEDQSGRFLKFLIQMADAACESMGRVDGVLAIKGPYDNVFFNLVFRFIQDFYLIIAIILLIIVAAKFFKGHYNMLYVGFIALVCICGFEVYANWLPTLLPQLYNFAVNDSIENIVWNTTFYNAESYKETYLDADNLDASSGTIKPYTGTITLYQLTNSEMREVANRNGIDLEILRRGDKIYLDENASIFVQGNLIKMSLDKLLINNAMRGLYHSQWEQLGTDYTGTEQIATVMSPENGNPYSIQLVQPYVSLESYYTPYAHFERAFMETLNTFASYFRIERNMFVYGDGDLYKDAFLVQSYIGSGIFTDPGNRETLKNNVQPDTIQIEFSDVNKLFDGSDIDLLLDAVMEAFQHPKDWLGLTPIFAEPDLGFQNSLWGKVMQSRGWYDSTWALTEYGKLKLSDMINYVNNQTKKWVIDNYNSFSYMSDENSIKMITLFATTCFTHYVSEFGDWLYPNYINASDIELQDVLYGSMVSLEDKNFAYDGTIVNTVGLNVGVFGVIFLLLIIILATVFVLIITYLVPVLYGLLGIIIIFKLINNQDHMDLIKGYTKVTLISALLYFLFSLSLQLVSVGGYRWYGFLLCSICLFFCNYFLYWVLLSVLQDLGNLGNSTLSRNLLRGLSTITGDKLAKLTSNHTQIFNRHRTNIIPRTAYMYSRASNVDEYDRPISRRSHLTGDSYYEAPISHYNSTNPGGYGRRDNWEEELGVTRSNRATSSSRDREGWTK